MGKRGVKFNPSTEEMLKVIAKAQGNIAAVARAYKVDRHTIYRRIRETQALVQAIENEREIALDVAESVLIQRALAGNTQELLFFLRTQGAHRGYSEKPQVEHTGSVTFKVIYGERPKAAE